MPPPKLLRQDPIVEATFEVRFAANAPAGELLPGMLFGPLRGHFTNIVPMPLAQIPRQLRQLQPEFAYQPSNAIIGDRKRLGIGDRVVNVSFSRPYPGWGVVRPVIEDVLRAIQGTALVVTVERVSLRFTNIITFDKDLSTLRVSFVLGDFKDFLPSRSLRAEIRHGGFTHIVQISTAADVTQAVPGTPVFSVSGLLVDVDSLANGPIQDPWTTIPNVLEELHVAEKQVFFGLLTAETIQRMDPVYDH
jgi:uncharacterized protein (TIGR04255 family)